MGKVGGEGGAVVEPAVLYLLADPPSLGATALPMPWKGEPSIGYLAAMLLADSGLARIRQ